MCDSSSSRCRACSFRKSFWRSSRPCSVSFLLGARPLGDTFSLLSKRRFSHIASAILSGRELYPSAEPGMLTASSRIVAPKSTARNDRPTSRGRSPVSQRRERAEPRLGTREYPPVKHDDLELREVLGDGASQQLAHMCVAPGNHGSAPTRDPFDEKRRQDARRGFTWECLHVGTPDDRCSLLVIECSGQSLDRGGGRPKRRPKTGGPPDPRKAHSGGGEQERAASYRPSHAQVSTLSLR